MTFKPGDVVVCVNDSPGVTSKGVLIKIKVPLTKGKIYRVSDVGVYKEKVLLNLFGGPSPVWIDSRTGLPHANQDWSHHYKGFRVERFRKVVDDTEQFDFRKMLSKSNQKGVHA